MASYTIFACDCCPSGSDAELTGTLDYRRWMVLPVLGFIASFWMSGCDQGAAYAVKPAPSPPPGFADFPGLPNRLKHHFEVWPSFPKSQLLTVDGETLRELRSDTELFDCSEYVINSMLREALLTAPHLRWLIVGPQATADDLQWIGQLKNLRGLSLWSATLENCDLRILGELRRLQWLSLPEDRGLRLSNESLPFSLPRLEVLYLPYCKDIHLPQPGQFPKLRKLDVRGTEITDSGIRKLVRANPGLVSLTISWNRRVTDASIPALAELKQLKWLSITRTTLNTQTVEKDQDIGWWHPRLQTVLPDCYINHVD